MNVLVMTGGMLVVLVTGVAAMLLLRLLLRALIAWVRRVVFKRTGERRVVRLDRQVNSLLALMGERLDRPWMAEELQVVAGLSESDVERCLARGKARKLVRRQWLDHPVTGEPFHAAMLTRRGLRLFGMYAPDDMHSVNGEEEESGEVLSPVLLPVEIEPSVPQPALRPAAAPPMARPMMPVTKVPRGFRNVRR